MKRITYNNINLEFTFENVCSKLTSFWLNEVMPLNKSKIWLTINVLNENNRSYILIKNLPFNASDFSDVCIVLKQVFNTNILTNRQDKMDRIIIEYRFNELKSKRFVYRKLLISLLILLNLILVLLLTLIVFGDISQIFWPEIIPEEILKEATNITEGCLKDPELYKITPSTTRTSVFQPCIDVFNCKYSYPSYFSPSNLKVDDIDFNLLEYIIYQQYVILDYTTTDLNNYINDLNHILEQYQSITNRLLK